MYRVLVNVRTSYGDFKAGVYDALPEEVIAELGEFVKVEQPIKPEPEPQAPAKKKGSKK